MNHPEESSTLGMVFQLNYQLMTLFQLKGIKPLILAGCILLLVSCRTGEAVTDTSPDINPTPTTQAEDQPGAGSRIQISGALYQWAIEAEASSEFADPEWSAEQAIGKPDSPGCGDYQFSWASAASDSIDTLTVRFPDPVYPLEIRIYESFNPDQIVKVEVKDPEGGGFYAVLQKNPLQVDRPCPYELVVPVEGIDFRSDTIRITVDQSQLGLGWNEIDAVQLIGTRTKN
jgi:hypothetical protein